MEYEKEDIKSLVNLIDKLHKEDPFKIKIQKVIEDYNELYSDYIIVKDDKNRLLGLEDKNIKLQENLKEEKMLNKKIALKIQRYILENKDLKDTIKDLKNTIKDLKDTIIKLKNK